MAKTSQNKEAGSLEKQVIPVPQSTTITVNCTGKIPRRLFENYSPYFALTEIYKEQITDQARSLRQETLYKQVEKIFNRIREEIKIEELQETFKNLRFTLNQDDGKRYPHVTDILYWDADFYISPEELTQYGARGSAIHAMIDNWLHYNGRPVPLTPRAPELAWSKNAISKRDAIILKTGTKRLWDTLDDINFLGFIEKHGKDCEFGEGEFRAFNKEHFYCGQLDRIGKYKGVPAMFDWKCRQAKDDDFKQMAAYINLDDPRLKGLQRMVVIPLNPDNKSGFGNPVVSDEPEKYFNLFLKDRHEYRDKFGI